MRRRIFSLSGISACGKSTMIGAISQGHPTLRIIISTTTRPIREGEEEFERSNYCFVTREEFERLEREGRLANREDVPVNIKKGKPQNKKAR